MEIKFNCPSCGVKAYWQNNEEGIFHCFSCNYEGMIKPNYENNHEDDHIENKEPINFKQITTADIKAIQFLKNRNISEDVIKEAKLGIQEDWIIFPYPSGYLKYRSINKKEFYSQGEVGLYHIPSLCKYKKAIILEGEIDLLSFLSQNPKVDAYAISGAGNFKKEFINIFGKYEIIYICLDNDEAGKEGTKKIKELLKDKIICEIRLPTKDMNEFISKEGKLKELKKYIIKPSLPPSFSSFAKEEPEEEVPFFISSLGNFFVGQTILFSALPKAGKTSFAIQLSLFLANNNFSVMFYSYEMTLKELQRIAYNQKEMLQQNIYINEDSLTLLQLMKDIKEQAVLNNIKIFIIDNLTWLMEGEALYLSSIEVLKKFKNLAKKYKILIFILAHPRKTLTDQITIRDIFGTGLVPALVDHVFIMNRIGKYKRKIEITSRTQEEKSINTSFLNQKFSILED